MRFDGTDIRKFGAVQLKVEEQPPQLAANYEILPGALLPTEYETTPPLGSLKITIYFRDVSRAALQRTMSAFMAQLRRSCVIDEIKGFKGKYKAFLTDDSYQATKVLNKKILELSFDGYFFDDEKEVTFSAVAAGTLHADGSRETPCIVEVTALSGLTNYTFTLNDEEYKIAQLAAGKTIIIDGKSGKATLDGVNAFGVVDMWNFPSLQPGANALTFGSTNAAVKIRFIPMWM